MLLSCRNKHHEELLNLSYNNIKREFVENILKNNDMAFERFTTDNVIISIQDLQNAKECGMGNVCGE